MTTALRIDAHVTGYRCAATANALFSGIIRARDKSEKGFHAPGWSVAAAVAAIFPAFLAHGNASGGESHRLVASKFFENQVAESLLWR
jgi:hypothetical protein